MSDVAAPVPVTLLLGNPRRGSRTAAVAARACDELRAALAGEGVDTGEPCPVDLALLGPLLPARMSAAVLPGGPIGQALAAVRRPGLLVVASPTFKGSYTGLLKLFLDMLPMGGLAGTVAVAAMTAGWPQHRYVPEMFLRPLLVELGAAVPAASLSVLEAEFADLDAAVRPWAATAATVLAAVLHRTAYGPARRYAQSASSRPSS